MKRLIAPCRDTWWLWAGFAILALAIAFVVGLALPTQAFN